MGQETHPQSSSPSTVQSDGVSRDAAVDVLKRLGLRLTTQRLALCDLLFQGPHRHLTADELYREAQAAKIPMSLGTIYNTLNQFSDAGLIRRISISADCTYFDTDVSGHQHYYIEAEDRVSDIPLKVVKVEDLPPPPEGYRVTKVDVVVHLERTSARN